MKKFFKRSPIHYLGVGLLVLGLGIIITGISMKLYAKYREGKLVSQFQNEMKDIGKVKNTNNGKSNKKTGLENGAIALIEIPKIDLNAPVCEGIDMDTLRFAVGHFKDTALPGQKGNCCLAGHRSYTYSELFNRLDEVNVNDYVILKTKNSEYKYKIYDKKVVKPEAVEVLKATTDEEITLVTCTPIRVGTHRLILKGKLCK